MKLILKDRGYAVTDMTAADVVSLMRMIDGADLIRRRDFYNLKRQAEEMSKNGLLYK